MSTNLAYAEPEIPEGQRIIEDDRNLIRHAWKAGAPMDLNRLTPSQFVGAFPGDVIGAHSLIHIPEARSVGPFEVPATIMHGDSVVQSGPGFATGAESSIPAPGLATAGTSFDPLGRNRGSRLTQFRNSPKLCAFILMRQYESQGLALFEDLKGVNKEDVRRMYSLFMPVKVNGAWDTAKMKEWGWALSRTVLEQEIPGPFLKDIREHLREGGRAFELLKAASQPGTKQATAEQIKGAKHMILQMRGACDRAWAFLNTRLNDTEKEIRRSRGGKMGKDYYDQIDERFTHATLPLDLTAMANTTRTPIDLQAAHEASQHEENQNSIMMRGFEMLADKIAGRPKGDVVTLEDVQKLMADRDAHWAAQIASLKREQAQSPAGESEAAA